MSSDKPERVNAIIGISLIECGGSAREPRPARPRQKNDSPGGLGLDRLVIEISIEIERAAIAAGPGARGLSLGVLELRALDAEASIAAPRN